MEGNSVKSLSYKDLFYTVPVIVVHCSVIAYLKLEKRLFLIVYDPGK